MKLEELVYKNHDKLNDTDLYIWQYILHHKRQCQKMTILELSQVCNLSHTRILDFTKKLGMDGYSELKVHLKWELDDEAKFDEQMLDKTIVELDDTLHRVRHMDLSKAMKQIDEAKRVFVYGTGVVQQNAAFEMKREFAYRQKILYVINGRVEIDTLLRSVSKDDVFIIISLSGENETSTNLVKFLNRLSIPVISICKEGDNFLSRNSNTCIQFKVSSFKTGYHDSFYSSTGHFFVIANMMFLKYLEYKSS